MPEPLPADAVAATAAALHDAVFGACGMDRASVEKLLSHASAGTARRGDEVTTLGAPVTWLVLVHGGADRAVAVLGKDGETIAELSAPTWLGEMTFLQPSAETDAGTASATCVAAVDVPYVAWDMAKLKSALSNDAHLSDDFHRALRRDATRKLQTANATTTGSFSKPPRLAPIPTPTTRDATPPNSPHP